MDNSSKWKQMKEYLKGKESRILSSLKTSAVGETPNELRAFGAQLALIEDILTQVERLDLADEVIREGRQAPAQPKY